MIASGYSNQEIGKRLGLKEETIKTHVRMILARLGARSRAHAVGLGFQKDLLTTILPDPLSDPSDLYPQE